MATETNKNVSIVGYWWENSKFAYEHGGYRALQDPSLNLDRKQVGQIYDGLEQLAENNNKMSASFQEWATYCQTVLAKNEELVTKFTKWYTDLVADTVYDFQWKLPRHKSADIPLVVYGYCRRVNVPIISDIIQTMIDYFGAFADKFDLHNLVKMSAGDRIHTSGDYYRSGVIEYKSLLFVLKLQRIEENQYHLLIEYVGVNGPKYMFYRCDLIVSVVCVEYGYRGCVDFAIDPTKTQNEEKIMRGIRLKHIKEMIAFGSVTFNLCFREITFDKQIYFNKSFSILKPSIINETILRRANMYKLQLSDADIIRMKELPLNHYHINSEQAFTIKSEPFIIHNIQCQIWLNVIPQVNSRFCAIHIYIYIYGFPTRTHCINTWFDVFFNNEQLIHTNRLYSQYTPQIAQQIGTEKIMKWIQENDGALPVFRFYFNLLDLYDCDYNKITPKIMANIQSFAVTSFEWKLSKQLISNIKECKSTENYFSDPFRVNSCVFILEIYPKNRRIEYDEETFTFLVQLHLVKSNQNIWQICIDETKYICVNNESIHNRSDSQIETFGLNNSISSQYWNANVSKDTIENQMNSAVIGCDLRVLHMSGVNSSAEQKEEKFEFGLKELRQTRFEWKISDKYYGNGRDILAGTQICTQIFDLFGCQWCIVFVPKACVYGGMHLYIRRIDLNTDIPFISVHCKLTVNELNIAFAKAKRLNTGQCIAFEAFIGDEDYKTNEMKNLTFALEMTLFERFCVDVSDMDTIAEIENTEMNELTELSLDSMTDCEEYKWQISEVGRRERYVSPSFKMKGNIEFQMQFEGEFYRGHYEASEVWICIKQLPKGIEALSLLVSINMTENQGQQSDAKIVCSDIVQFEPNKLESKVTSDVQFEMKYDRKLTLQMKVKIIGMREGEKDESAIALQNSENGDQNWFQRQYIYTT